MGVMTAANPPVAIGLPLPTWPRVDRSYATWPELRSLALEAEAMGVDTLWVPDHLQRSLGGGERIGFWECWTIVTALAEATSTVGIGPHVACTGFRNPGAAGQDGGHPRRGERRPPGARARQRGPGDATRAGARSATTASGT